MDKFWTSFEKNDTSIIILENNVIYFGKAKAEEIDSIIFDFKLNKSHPKLFSLPISYINEIHLSDKTNYLEVIFKGNSTEQLLFNDKSRKEEVFAYFKNIQLKISYTESILTKLETAKKPLIALALLIGLFLWSLYLAIEINAGANYEIIGNKGSITAIVLGIAYIGVPNVIMIFGTLILIAVISCFRKMKNQGMIRKLIFD